PRNGHADKPARHLQDGPMDVPDHRRLRAEQYEQRGSIGLAVGQEDGMARGSDLAPVRPPRDGLVRIQACAGSDQQQLADLEWMAREWAGERDAHGIADLAPARQNLVGTDLAAGSHVGHGAARKRDAVDRRLAVLVLMAADGHESLPSRRSRPTLTSASPTSSSPSSPASSRAWASRPTRKRRRPRLGVSRSGAI